MPSFCVKCGSPLTGGPFCTKCGARSLSPQPPIPAQPAPASPQPLIPPAAGPAPVQPATSSKGMSTLAKLGIAALGVVLVAGAAGVVGVYYVAHKVSQKYHEVSDDILGSSATPAARRDDRGGSAPAGSSDSRSTTGSMGNVCRFLSKEDVSKAVGIEIIRTEPVDNGCSYVARGTQREMTAKHAAAMVGDVGADKKTQQIAEQFASGVFKMTQGDKPPSPQDASGEVPVFTFSLDQNAAEQQMRINAKVFGNIGSQQGLPGIGDQAFVSADGMIMIRKGKTLVRIMYLTCPCGLEQVKPLAKEIADAL